MANDAEVVWLDKHTVSFPDGLVFCALRDADVLVEKCLDCQWLVRADPVEAPRAIVCDATAIAGWLGFTEL